MPIIDGMKPWSKGHSGQRRCLACNGLADCKPADFCSEQRHWHRHQVKQARNNEYRRERRSLARAAGTIYRLGRGNIQSKTEYNIKRHIALREHLFAVLGGAICGKCGFSDRRALQFDHINGGGGRHRRSLRSGSAYYLMLKSMNVDQIRATFQVLCANCNTIKREELFEWKRCHAHKNTKEKN